jgi:hypothetical protein
LRGGNEGLKDGLQEIPKGDKWSRRHFSSLGNVHLHLKGVSAIRQCKKATKPTPYPDPQDHWFPGPPAFPNMLSFSFLLQIKFSTNKIFPIPVVRVCLCFHSQSRLKNPEHLKFLCMSSVHQKHKYWKCPMNKIQNSIKTPQSISNRSSVYALI